jgi:hypothetical protein
MSDKKKTKDVTVDETQKSKETVVKKEDILEIGQTIQKLKEMHIPKVMADALKATQVRVVPDLGSRFDSTNLIPKYISTSP